MNIEDTRKNDCLEIEIPFPLFQYLSAEHCNLQYICRICLSDNNNELFSLLSSEDNGLLQELFTTTTDIQVRPDDGLPSHICNNCKVQLINCYEFKVKCIKSDCTLKSLLKGEFYTKEEKYAESLEPSKDFATTFVEPTKDSEEKTSEIENEEEIVDVQYLEDLSGSDTEILCMVQDAEKNVENKEVHMPITTKNTSNKKPKTRVCAFCSKRFKNSKAVAEHVKRIHGSAKKRHSCRECKDAYQSDHDLNLHLPVHGPGPTWKCVECSKEFKGRSMFRRHIQRHMQVKRYSCPVCKKQFAELYALRRHSRVHTGERVEKHHVCHICSNRYSESGLLARHLARHEGSRPCVCAECGKGFASERLLASHALVHSDTKPHQCHYCDKRFRHESTRNTHHRTHTGEKPYVCATCGKRFIQNSNLTLHMRTHTGEKPYACEKCGRSFSTGSTLKAHIRTHTGDKPYSCPVCCKKFARRDMSAHMRQHTGERPFACAVCARAFVTAARLREHSRIHTGEKPYGCTTCHQKFSHKSLLVKHTKVHELQKKPSTSRRVENNDKYEEESPSMPISSGICEDSGNLQIVNMDDTESRSREELEITHAIDDTSGCLSSDPICLTTRIESDEDFPSEMNLVSVSDIEDSGVRIAANALEGNVPVKLYQVDHSLVQIHSSGGQVTIRKFTSKMTTNF